MTETMMEPMLPSRPEKNASMLVNQRWKGRVARENCVNSPGTHPDQTDFFSKPFFLRNVSN